MEYANILVGTDGSALMDKVYEHCTYLGRITNASVHVVYVVDIARYAAIPIDSAAENIYSVTLEEGRKITENAKKILVSRGLSESIIHVAVLDGRPATELNLYVHDHTIDLIIIGTHGRHRLDRLLIGSVADKVIRAATVPVLLVGGASKP